MGWGGAVGRGRGGREEEEERGNGRGRGSREGEGEEKGEERGGEGGGGKGGEGTRLPGGPVKAARMSVGCTIPVQPPQGPGPRGQRSHVTKGLTCQPGCGAAVPEAVTSPHTQADLRPHQDPWAPGTAECLQGPRPAARGPTPSGPTVRSLGSMTGGERQAWPAGWPPSPPPCTPPRTTRGAGHGQTAVGAA